MHFEVQRVGCGDRKRGKEVVVGVEKILVGG